MIHMLLACWLAHWGLLVRASFANVPVEVDSNRDALSMLQMETRALPAESEDQPPLDLVERLPSRPAASMEYVQLCRDNPAEYTDGDNHSEAILHVEMKSYDLELWAFRLKDAMNKAKLKINEWEPVGPPFGTHAILSNDSFPQIYNVTIRRTTQYLDLEEGFESEEDHIIAIEAEKEAEQTVKEMNEHVKHPGVGEHEISNSSDDIMSAVTIGSDGSVVPPEESVSATTAKHLYEINYNKIHGITTWDDVREEVLAAGGMNTENMGFVTPPPGAELGEGELILSDRHASMGLDDFSLESSRRRRRRRGKKKNKKQKEWVSKALGKLEGDMCARNIRGKPVSKLRSTRGMSCDFRRRRRWWPDVHCHCRGWEQIGLICHGYCSSGWYPVWFACHKSCGSWEDTLSTCNKRCARDNSGEKFATTCGLGYCSVNDGACVAFVAKIAVAFLEMLSNFIPGAAAMNRLRAVAKTLVKAGLNAARKMALKAAIKSAVRTIKKRLMKEAKANLKKYMKEKAKELKEELQEDLLEGGAEQVAETMIAKTEGGAIKDMALEMVKAVDPTGISGVVGAFEADSCDSKYIDDMPEDDLDQAVCPDEIQISGNVPEQTGVPSLWEMMDDEFDGRPVYSNPHGYYLYSLWSHWVISDVVGAKAARGDHHYNEDCPKLGSVKGQYWGGKWVTRTLKWSKASPRRRDPPRRRQSRRRRSARRRRSWR